MDFWDITKLIARRWYFSVPMLVVSISAAFLTGTSVKPDYSSTGHLQLIPPLVTADAADKAGRSRNPWADLGVGALGEAVMVRVRGQEVIDELVAAGYTESFTVSMDGRSPIILIESVGRTPQQARGTTRQVLKLLDEDVAAKQRVYFVPQAESITTLALDDGTNVTKVTSKTKRALIVVVGVGLLLTMAATIALDAMLRRWARRRSPFTLASRSTSAPESNGLADAQVNRVQLANGQSGTIAVIADGHTQTHLGNGQRKAGPTTANTPMIAVEFQSADPTSSQQDALTSSQRDATEHNADVTAAVQTSELNADATIVLPLSHAPWPARDDKSKRP